MVVKPRLAVFAVALTFACIGAARAQNCAGVTTGLVPLNDLGTGTYQGFQGGLYPGGANVRPLAHAAAGAAQIAGIVPRDASGAPSATGRIVFLSIGMSNTTQEFTQFLGVSNGDPLRNPRLVVVDGAQGGQDAAVVANPNSNFWTVVQQRLTSAGVTAAQVQACWVKEAEIGPTQPFPLDAQILQADLASIARNLHAKFTNVRAAFFSSRTYAGYASTTLNPEPHAYQSGFSVKWLIESQINGDPSLNFDPAMGPVMAPWVSWGPYLWADGLTPRSDGLVWECRDFQPSDGTHPNVLARFKVASLLDAFFRGDPLTAPWYTTATPHAVPAARALYGNPSAGAVPQLTSTSNPFLGNPSFTLGVQGAAPNSSALIVVSAAYDDVAVTPSTHVYVDVTRIILPAPGLPLTFPTNGSGQGALGVAIPPDPQLMAAVCYVQILVLDPTSTAFPQLGGATLTRGLRLVLGSP